ncbi:hypothetical protein GMOD_00008574 [Pyrenophora seminiperda CCB06]|uniref:Uncharacterized protein n=1 Tax=Pyrenophora seminiperda CCB06 TaxID=1302712 RepID=A0A3M7M935_9PLEO|nr:hypothetical protein GMOD_00008574 [Pyrenophora seminiperda CCB06]
MPGERDSIATAKERQPSLYQIVTAHTRSILGPSWHLSLSDVPRSEQPTANRWCPMRRAAFLFTTTLSRASALNHFGLQRPLQEPLRRQHGRVVRLFRHNAYNILICHHMAQPHLLWHMSGARSPHQRVLERFLQRPMHLVANVLNRASVPYN